MHFLVARFTMALTKYQLLIKQAEHNPQSWLIKIFSETNSNIS